MIVVRYYTDNVSEKELIDGDSVDDKGVPIRCRTDIPIELPTPIPDVAKLDEMILQRCPISLLQKFESINDPEINTNMDSIADLVGIEKSISEEDLQKILPPTPVDIDAEIEELLKKLE